MTRKGNGNTKQLNIGCLIIATGKYKMFVQNLIDDIKKYFLIDHNITVYLFTDATMGYGGDDRVTIVQHEIPSYRFPDATMLRYHIFTSRKYYDCDYLFYLDVDMSIRDEIGEQILGTIVAVIHPGFYRGGGSWETRPESETYVPIEKRKKYFAGGFQGGMMPAYYAAMLIMKDMIDSDNKKGIIPIWHDESAWNAYLSNLHEFTELPPSYVMVEEEHLRKAWKIDGLPVKIVALAKNHAEIRS